MADSPLTSPSPSQCTEAPINGDKDPPYPSYHPPSQLFPTLKMRDKREKYLQRKEAKTYLTTKLPMRSKCNTKFKLKEYFAGGGKGRKGIQIHHHML